MDDLMARTMVENLSIGIDPLTGRALSPRDCCANELVQEALKMVLDNCSLESYGTILERRREEREKAKQERKERRAERYPNAGMAWTKEEDRYLHDMYVYTKAVELAWNVVQKPISQLDQLVPGLGSVVCGAYHGMQQKLKEFVVNIHMIPSPCQLLLNPTWARVPSPVNKLSIHKNEGHCVIQRPSFLIF